MRDFKQSLESVVICDQNAQSTSFQQLLSDVETSGLVGVSYQLLSSKRYNQKSKLALIQISTQKRHFLIDCLSISAKEMDQIYE